MKVGLSLSRCVRDIFEGRVDYRDVLVIVSRTDFDPDNDEHWDLIWNSYLYGDVSLTSPGNVSNPVWPSPGNVSNPVWHGLGAHETEIREICQQLYKSGKLHQPRQYGSGNPFRADYVWLDTVVSEDDLEDNPAVKKAWEQYQMLAGLTKT